jgi:CheY-like chemotaxis protein
MSHELRTPLSAVLGFSELLQLGMVGEAELADSYNSIHRAGQHLLHLINDVLDISSIEAGRLRFSVEPVSLGEVTIEVLQLVRSMAVSHQINIHNDIPIDPDIYVSADRQRLKQILVNLLVNGIKYNRVGGNVAIRTGKSPAGKFRIEVQDTGPGMSPEQLERLFTPFDRLGAERTEVEGTGLGLALSKRLTEAMDGVLGVDSVAGQGSTFWIELPLAAGHADHLPTHDGSLEVIDSTAKESAHSVLYIEDNLTSIKLVERIMQQRQGIKLLVAMQGRLGLEFARQHRPDLILLDLQLPDIQGNEVLLRLKADPATREIPVVMLSADATPRQQESLLRAGAQSYLTKPLSVRRLLRMLDELLPVRVA